MNSLYPDFQRFQQAFARHVRDPWHAPRPTGVTARGMNAYNELLYNNLRSFLDACFPVCRDLLGERAWSRLCRCFYRDWPQRSSWFRDIPGNFATYLHAGEIRQPLPHWLADLAHYEWVELAVDIDASPPPALLAGADPWEFPVALNPSLRNLNYAWPVHVISREYRPRKPRMTHLLVYRDADERVQFIETNALTARLLELLAGTPLSGEQALQLLAKQQATGDHQHFLQHGRMLLQQLQQQGVIIGACTA